MSGTLRAQHERSSRECLMDDAISLFDGALDMYDDADCWEAVDGLIEIRGWDEMIGCDTILFEGRCFSPRGLGQKIVAAAIERSVNMMHGEDRS